MTEHAAALLIGTLAVARAVRLLTSDAYPPVEALRVRWQVWNETRDAGPSGAGYDLGTWEHVRHGWGPLLTCPFCAAPYVTAITLAVAIAADVWEPDLGSLSGWWWTLAVWAAVSYAAAMIVARDEPPEDA